jgi:hypothetical protein
MTKNLALFECSLFATSSVDPRNDFALSKTLEKGQSIGPAGCHMANAG